MRETTPGVMTFHGNDALDYVVSQNIRRRHLNKDQLAILALELEKKFAAEIAEDTRKRGVARAKEHDPRSPALDRHAT